MGVGVGVVWPQTDDQGGLVGEWVLGCGASCSQRRGGGGGVRGWLSEVCVEGGLGLGVWLGGI